MTDDETRRQVQELIVRLESAEADCMAEYRDGQCRFDRNGFGGMAELLRDTIEALALLAQPGTPAEPQEPQFCYWNQDDYGGCSVWETACGQAFEFNDGGPKENGVAFCGYCGKTLVEQRTSEDVEACERRDSVSAAFRPTAAAADSRPPEPPTGREP